MCSSDLGVEVARFQHFVILDLKPLSAEQQSTAVSNQLANAEQFKHMAAFSEIRRGHDRIYKETAFPDEAERREIETFEQPNLFFKDGTRDSDMRQRRRDGAGFVRVCKASEPASAYLRRLCGFFSAPLLAELDAALEGALDEAGVKAAVACLSSEDAQRLRAAYGEGFFDLEDDASAEPARMALNRDAAFKDLKLAVKLGLLLQKRREKEPALTLPALWERVWRRTDDVFVATEDLKQVFEEAVRKFAGQLGLTEEALKFGPLKDAVRIHEKALDDYLTFFEDSHPPEACVVDVLRATVVCPSGEAMLRLLRAPTAALPARSSL